MKLPSEPFDPLLKGPLARPSQPVLVLSSTAMKSRPTVGRSIPA